MHLPSDNPDTNHSLVIDCSEGEVFCGLLGPSGQWLSSKQSGPGALEAVFPAVASVFHDAGKSLQSVDRFLYCQGPGSVLGLRLGAMAIETWCRLAQKQVERMSYNSLQLTAALLLLDNKELDNALLLADWKKNTWHSLRINNRTIGQVSPIAAANTSGEDYPIYHLPRRKGWQAPPTGACTLPYEPDRLNAVLDAPGLFEATPVLDLYQSGGNTFAKWNQQRHRSGSL
jgi:tRNA threonylcarbamoyladenosine biosynthesis protein TsaB